LEVSKALEKEAEENAVEMQEEQAQVLKAWALEPSQVALAHFWPLQFALRIVAQYQRLSCLRASKGCYGMASGRWQRLADDKSGILEPLSRPSGGRLVIKRGLSRFLV
jgi:hypothetical protein